VTALYEIKLNENVSGDWGTIFVRYKDPYNFQVSEVAEKINSEVFRRSFNDGSKDFRLAAAAAEFAEILRNSYWARGSQLGDVLAVVQSVERESSNPEVIGLMDLIAKARAIKDANSDTIAVPLGMGE
jgi:Ca-activated chloride channel family protein